ncbi:MAG: PKD domain-containing protein [Planctomycetota bacterium]
MRVQRAQFRTWGFLLVVAMIGVSVGGCPPIGGNQSPTANAGANQTVQGGANVTLNGSASTDPDGDPLSFSWQQLSGPNVTLNNANSAIATFTAPAPPATLVFRLTVDDGQGGTASVDTTVTVSAAANQPPTANAGPDQNVQGGATVTLAGSGTDPENTPLSFNWTQTAGAVVTLSDPNVAGPTFAAPLVSGTLTFQLTVTDGAGASATDAVNITITVPPVLFIANFAAPGNVTSYVNPSTVNGNIAPSTNLAGAQTQLTTPADIVVDSAGALYATNHTANSITVYNNAADANGNFPPNRNVSGPATGLSLPASLAIGAGDVLFVANFAAPFSITIYIGVSTAAFNGNVAPTRTIAGAATLLNQPTGINLDAAGNLYVANRGGTNVLVFANAANLNGNVAPTRIITSAAFNQPFDVYIDPADRMYVTNQAGGQLNTFNNAGALNGAIMPNFTLTVPGAVQLNAIVVDSANTGYIADFGANRIVSYDNIATLNGILPPTRTISGATTQLNGPIRLFLLER